MLKIGRSAITRKDGTARLTASISTNLRTIVLWFSVPEAQADCLTVGRADPFLLALLPAAMHGGHEIICEDPVSERLHYQLCNDLIPALASVGDWYQSIRVTAPTTNQPHPNQDAVGTGFSGGVDSLFTIYCHGTDSECPLTHIAVFTSGVFEGTHYRDGFATACGKAAQFGNETGLKTVFVDTNFVEVLPERFLDVYSFRNLSCALALQGLFSTYLLSSGHDAGNFHIDLHNAASFDPLTVFCAGTESLTFYNAGTEVKRWEKLNALSQWPVSYRWLHPCVYGYAGEKNCGHCKKCARDLTTLYALCALDLYNQVIDVKAYHHNIAARIGFVLANRGNHLYDETILLLQKRAIAIPSTAYVYEKQFRRFLMRNER